MLLTFFALFIEDSTVMLQYNIEHTGKLKRIKTFLFSCVIIDIDALRIFKLRLLM